MIVEICGAGLKSKFEISLALANSAIFFALSVAVRCWSPTNLLITLLPNITFLAVSIVVWLRMMRAGWALTPVCWFILGTSVFFGFGAMAGAIHVNPWSEKHYANGFSHVLTANVINSLSVFCVLLTAMAVIAVQKLSKKNSPKIDWDGIWRRALPFLISFSALSLILRLTFFPDAEDLVLRSFLSKIQFISPSLFLIFGIQYRLAGSVERLAIICLLAFQIILGILLFNKTEMLTPIMAFMIGAVVYSRSYKLPLLLLVSVAWVFWFTNPLISMGRLHGEYHATENTVFQRMGILADTVNASLINRREILNPGATATPQINVAERMAPIERARSVGLRFDIASIQGFLIKEYDEGRPGFTLADSWTALIPRFLWIEKPIITRFGTELNVRYHDNDPAQRFSAIAPTYTGEAYWNYGWLGVIVVSVYLGICFGIFSIYGFAAGSGTDPSYLFVAYPLIVSAAFVESWITATYVGGMITIVLYYVTFRFLIRIFSGRYVSV